MCLYPCTEWNCIIVPMTLADPIDLEDKQHIVLTYISWDFYEKLLYEIGNRSTRVTFDNATIEIMAPLPIHEVWKHRIARLVDFMSVELSIDMENLGSATFKRKDLAKGLEPDACFYIQNWEVPRGKYDMDLTVDPPPDLAIEIDITNRSVPRQPIYAALGVPELWRFDGKRLQVLELQRDKYVEVKNSLSFPFLPIRVFESYVSRQDSERTNDVIRDFSIWVRTLNGK